MARILIMLTSETEGMAIEEALHGDFDVTLCSDPIEAAMNLQRDYDAMILDLFLPGDDGLSILKQNRNHCPAVIILLTNISFFSCLSRACNSLLDICREITCYSFFSLIINGK